MATATKTGPHEEGDGPINEVRLRGRLSGEPVERALPSGDVVVTFRLVVDRPEGGGVRVDTLDCAAFRADARRRVLGAAHGDVIEVGGALRRRFFRSGVGSASRYEVEVRTVARSRGRTAARVRS
jgi:single-strand DNA-binding protein